MSWSGTDFRGPGFVHEWDRPKAWRWQASCHDLVASLSILRDLVWLYQFCEILCGHMGAFDDEILTTCKAQSLETTQVGAKKDQAPSPCCNVNHKTRSPSFPTEKCLHCSNLAFSHCWIFVVTLSSIVSPVISVPVKDLPLYHNTQILVRNSNCTTLPKWLWCSSSRMINWPTGYGLTRAWLWGVVG